MFSFRNPFNELTELKTSNKSLDKIRESMVSVVLKVIGTYAIQDRDLTCLGEVYDKIYCNILYDTKQQ
jgi:hypothetical protein